MAEADNRTPGGGGVVGAIDVSDRAARLLGIVYGSQGQQILQRAATFDLLTQLRHAGVEIDPRDIRALTSADVVDVSDRVGRLLGVVNSITNAVDVSDRAARLLGVVYGSQGQQILQRAATFDAIVQLRSAGVEIDPRSIRALTSADVVDVSDRVGRLLGVVNSITNAVDVSDRAARLLGVVYGSQGQQILQRAASFDSLVQLRSAGAEIDPRQIRALINTDIVSSELTKVGGTVQTGRDWSGDFSKLDVALSTRAALKQTSSRIPISIAAAGDNTILAASPGNKHKLVKLFLLCAAAVNVILKSGANNLTGAMPFAANGGMAVDGDFYPLELNTNEAFIINLSGAVQVSGWAQYFTEV